MGYLKIEAESQRNEMMLAASGTLAAIAQAFNGKSSRAMASFRQGLGGGGAAAGDSGAMGDLRSRIGKLVADGQRAAS